MINATLLLIALLGMLSIYSGIVTYLYIRHRVHKPMAKIPPSVTKPMRLANSQSEEEKEQRIKEKADEALRLSQTFQKFVPRQFVEHFAKHGSETLELGRADEDDVAILFCDIRGFSGLSERMQPQELMNFLNSYFLRMNDPIHQNGGFIDKFIGDAIMALFDHPGGTQKDKAQDALSAALDLRKALTIYNEHRGNSGYPPINVGIGIHFGPVIIGTVGSDDRMDTTVIGDSVNIAFRLETLSPTYYADIVVSAKLLETVGPDYPVKARLLDWVRVKGRQAPVEIYEVLSHLPPEQQENRLAINDRICAGVACRTNQDWEGALQHFNKAQQQSPEDPLPGLHIKICEKYRSESLAQNWDGALPINGKD